MRIDLEIEASSARLLAGLSETASVGDVLERLIVCAADSVSYSGTSAYAWSPNLPFVVLVAF